MYIQICVFHNNCVLNAILLHFNTQVKRPNERLSAQKLENGLMAAQAGITEIHTKLDGLDIGVKEANKGIHNINEKLTLLIEALPGQLGQLRADLLSMVETAVMPMLRECLTGELQPMREELRNLSDAMQNQVLLNYIMINYNTLNFMHYLI